jgi:uncharacterized protein
VLERVFLLDRLPPWHKNRLGRLVKTAKLHVGDTGLACALLGVDAVALSEERDRLWSLLETFVQLRGSPTVRASVVLPLCRGP